MTNCYYCVDYDAENHWCNLFNKSASDVDEDCDYFEFDTGIDQTSEVKTT